MLAPEPLEVTPKEEKSRSWPSLLVSGGIHVLIILLLLFGLPTPRGVPMRTPPAEEVAQPIALEAPPPTAHPTPRQQVQPPPPPPPPTPTTPPPPPPPPPPPTKVQILGPDTKKDVPIPKQAAAEKAPEAPPTAEPTPPAEAKQPVTQPQQVRRIPRIGDYAPTTIMDPPTTSPISKPNLDVARNTASDVSRPNAMGRLGTGAHDPREWNPSEDAVTEGKCVQPPKLGTNADGTPVKVSVSGYVYDGETHAPLGNAMLFVVGTAAMTTTTANGAYRLEFDPKLVANCNMQEVRVKAPGHEDQTLYLGIGPQQSSDVNLKRNH